MRILHVVPVYEPAWRVGAGVVRAVSLLCRGLSSLGVDVTVYTTNCGMDGDTNIPSNRSVDVGGVEVIYFHSEIFRSFRYSRALREACKERVKSFDIVHLASFWNYPGIPAGAAARRADIPYVISPHGTLARYSIGRWDFKKKLYLSLIEKQNLKYAAAIHYTAEIEKTDMAWQLNNPGFIVPNGLNSEEFDNLPSKAEARNQLGIPIDSIVLTFLGRLHRHKAIDVFIHAFSRLVESHDKAILLLAGPDDGHESSLRALVERLGLNHMVRFLGFVNSEERKRLLAASDVLELVSWGENFGYTAAEAMAAGVPVLVSENVGLYSVEADGAGYTVLVQAEAIAEKLRQMLSNPLKLKEMGEAAYESARRRYHIRSVSQQMVMAYEDILTGNFSPELQWVV